MESDKKDKVCYIPYLCDGEDCCLCKFRSLNGPLEPMSDDTACDLAIAVWESLQATKQMQEQINGMSSKNEKN